MWPKGKQIDERKSPSTNIAGCHGHNAIEWITKAFNVIKDKETLVRAERNVAGRSVDFLTTLYAFKRDKARGKDQKAMDAYDALYNTYDKLHDKYN